MKKNKEAKTLRGEKIIWLLIFLVLFTTPLIHVVTKSKLSQTNIEVERLKKDISKQENVNESLNMKINELASLDKIREVAESNGLSYKNNNIKVVE